MLPMLAACGSPSNTAALEWRRLAELPEPVANNAVAALAIDNDCTLVSVLGIDASRSAAGIHARAWIFDGAWQALPDVPGFARIAASAVALRGQVYVLGGYSVGADGAETSHASVDILDLATRSWTPAPPLPIPIDDAAAVAWRDRWIVVVSGWSNTRPVPTVQMFDAETGRWNVTSDFPGTPVFGHAGAIVGDDLVIVDGVGSSFGGFEIQHQTWHGRLDPADPPTVRWARGSDHPGLPRYRTAAGTSGGLASFHGGTSEPYNFDGLSYASGDPATPLPDAIVFDPALGAWIEPPPVKPTATMDHRALVGCGDRLVTIGGMEAGPMVTGAVWELAP